MKKFMIGLLFIILLSTTLSANAETVVLKANSYDKLENAYFDYHNVDVLSNQEGNFFWWTGTEFIKCSLLDTKFTKSDDLVEWSDMNLSDDARMKISRQYSANIKHYGDKYIVYDEIFNPSIIIDKMERTHGPIIMPIYILDENFNLLCEVQLDNPLTDFEYVDGVYYIETQEYTQVGTTDYELKNNTIYYSYDAIDWQIDNERSSMPQSNGRNSLVFQGELVNFNASDYRFEVKDMFIEKNKSDLIKVVQERPITCYYKAKGNIYVEIQYYIDNVNTFRISRDGVYSVDVAIPEYSGNISGKSEFIFECNLWKDKLVIRTRKRLIEYDMADIEDVLNEKCPSDTPYIEFNGNILGFDVPPIIEDGSTLVPMRFLFEQMGADVEWDSETQTATATIENKAVTFSIDNVNARINNKPAKMDVPARLVNGKTMVPLRFLSENMGYDVDWDADSRTAIIQ